MLLIALGGFVSTCSAALLFAWLCHSGSVER